ncbi:MAG: acetamidase/formamidase family protein [Chloroflexia bacterium]|nr:acetamidase/formamidase family protein [Chloroflexia bacterium]
MNIHTLEPDERTLHGVFSRDFEPMLTIDSGDTVRFRTLDARWSLEPTTEVETPAATFPLTGERRGDGHALTGPVFVRGAQPGHTLQIDIGPLRPGAWGWTFAGGTDGLYAEQYRKLGLEDRSALLAWTLDADEMTGQDQLGHTVALRPFMGVMGMPPAQSGTHSTRPPRTCGGNIDCKELVTGTTLYLPVEVEGALFSTGDGHAAQGDGEVSGMAIECPMDAAELTLTLREDMSLSTPRAETPSGWLTFGFHEDLHEAGAVALSAMLDLMGERLGLDRPEALALASVVVDLRITQIVNGVRGIHAFLAHDAVEQDTQSLLRSRLPL